MRMLHTHSKSRSERVCSSLTGDERDSDAVVATALLDLLLHHAIVIQIEGSSYRLREHAQLLPEHMRSRPTPANPAEQAAKPRRARRKERG